MHISSLKNDCYFLLSLHFDRSHHPYSTLCLKRVKSPSTDRELATRIRRVSPYPIGTASHHGWSAVEICCSSTPWRLSAIKKAIGTVKVTRCKKKKSLSTQSRKQKKNKSIWVARIILISVLQSMSTVICQQKYLLRRKGWENLLGQKVLQSHRVSTSREKGC